LTLNFLVGALIVFGALWAVFKSIQGDLIQKHDEFQQKHPKPLIERTGWRR